jgi:hypothetical protein
MVEQKRREILKSLEGQELKQWMVREPSTLRILYVFEAPTDAQDGAPCLVTEFIYVNPTSNETIGKKEYTGKWQSEWDANFVFDPAADYDTDADGIL